MIEAVIEVATGTYAGTPIEWLPESVVNIWRFAFFIANIYVLSQILTMTLTRHDARTPFRQHFAAKSMMWLWIGIVLFLIRGCIIQIERFGDKAVYEGLPLQSLVLFCMWRGVYLFRKGC